MVTTRRIATPESNIVLGVIAIEIVSKADRAIVSVMILEEEVLMSASLCVLSLEMLLRLDFVRQVSASSFLDLNHRGID